MTVAGLSVCMLLGWIGVDAFRRNKLERAWEAALADLACPSCSIPFGQEAAHLARKGVIEQQRLKRARTDGLIIDNFGSWAIDCPHCKSEFSVEPEPNELIAYEVSPTKQGFGGRVTDEV